MSLGDLFDAAYVYPFDGPVHLNGFFEQNPMARFTVTPKCSSTPLEFFVSAPLYHSEPVPLKDYFSRLYSSLTPPSDFTIEDFQREVRAAERINGVPSPRKYFSPSDTVQFSSFALLAYIRHQSGYLDFVNETGLSLEVLTSLANLVREGSITSVSRGGFPLPLENILFLEQGAKSAFAPLLPIIQGIAVMNLGLVYSSARRYYGTVPLQERPEILASAKSGLFKAIERFLPVGRFSTFAVWWIRQGARTEFKRYWSKGLAPHSALSKVQKLRRLESTFFAQYGRSASPQEIADYSVSEQQRYDLNQELLDHCRKRNSMAGLRRPLSVYEVENAIAADVARKPISLDAPVNSEDDDSALLGSFKTMSVDEESEPDSILFNKELRDIVEALLCSINLNPREKRIFEARLFTEGEPLPLVELGKEFGVTRERMRQIEKKLKRKFSFRLSDMGYSASDLL